MNKEFFKKIGIIFGRGGDRHVSVHTPTTYHEVVRYIMDAIRVDRAEWVQLHIKGDLCEKFSTQGSKNLVEWTDSLFDYVDTSLRFLKERN